jgi:YhcH/YjgK/YiaL family protein
MITDRLANADLYRNLHPRLTAALDWLRDTDLASLPLGKTVIDGEYLFALIQEYTPKPLELGKFEAHRRYWDVQYVARGEERMGWVNLADVSVSEPHSLERDVAFFTGGGSFFRIPAGSLAIFGPEDVHMPGVAPEEGPASSVRKVVVKVEV